MNKIATWLKMMLFENEKLSLTNFITFGSFLFFIFVTLYFMITQTSAGWYESFGMLTMGGGMATKLGNKLINSKLNSPLGQLPQLYKSERMDRHDA